VCVCARGTGIIGGNKILLEENGRGILLDFGMNFARYGEYYQEFLKERSNRGIYDLIHLNMIPKINVYRPSRTYFNMVERFLSYLHGLPVFREL